jgi:K+-transporting ATPase ATPase C chain
MFMHLKPAVIMLLIWTVLTGVFYPALVTGIAQALFHDRANGSFVRDSQGKAVGSELIGQPFSAGKYFWGRPSATAPHPYNAAASSGSNQGPANPTLADAVKARIEALHAADPDNKTPVPVDLITASGSGLDPHISPAAAEYQANRVAKARHLDAKVIRKTIADNTENRQWGLFGEPRVNVLLLNRALDAPH